MPSGLFRCAWAFMFARIAESGIASMSPAPNTGVGMRKTMFGFPPLPVSGFPAGRNLGWAILHPAASLRPVMTNRLCTPPSLVPSGLRLKRASRMGPLCVMNHGTTFLAPSSVAILIKGLVAGLDPPTLGCEWQDRHWFEVKRGPSPTLSPPHTDSMSRDLASPFWKNAGSYPVRPSRAVTAPGPKPLRGAQQVAEWWKRYYEGPDAPFSWQPEDVEVLDSGTLAISSGPVRDPKGALIATFTSIWRLEDTGTWRIIFDRGNEVCPPKP